MAKSVSESKLLEYKDTISQLNMTIANQNLLINTLRETLESNTVTINNLQEQIDYLTKKLFGTSSEKTSSMEGQMYLFDEAELESDFTFDDIESVVKEHTRKSKRTSEETFKGIPVIEEIYDLSDEEKICNTCETTMVLVGKELVRREFRYTPAKGEVVAIYTNTYKCPECTAGNTPDKSYEIVKANAPLALIPHSYASESSVAWTMYQKYFNSIPLYRQEKDWEQIGASFSRATLGNWILYCSKNYLLPMYNYFHRELLKREFLMADETRIQVLKEPDRKPETNSFMWLYRTGEDGLNPIIVYGYSQTRAGLNAEKFLKGFKGYLETDAYKGYNRLKDVKRCCCWAHARRYFIDAVPKGKSFDLSVPAVQGVQYCNKLFEYERKYREEDYSHKQRYEARLRDELPVLEAFWSWLEAQTPTKNSKFYKSVNYVYAIKDGLMRYLEDGRCSFTNNASENSIRPFTVGRKNWLFADTPKGAEASAIVYTIIETAKAYNLNIYEYLKYLLSARLSEKSSDDEINLYAPWNESVKEQFKLN